MNVTADIQQIKTMDEFERITKSPHALIEIYSDSCHFCAQAEKPFALVAQDAEFSSIIFARINYDDLSNFLATQGVKSVPVFWYFKDGQKVKTESGIKNIATFADHLTQELRSLIKTVEKEIAPTSSTAQIAKNSCSDSAGNQASCLINKIIEFVTALFTSLWNAISNLFGRLTTAL